MRLTLRAIADATAGEVLGDRALEVLGVDIDSRRIAPGELFVAVRAERDGHEFVGHAAERGAAAALVDRARHESEERGRRSDGLPVVRVDDTVRALGRLAADVGRRSGADVVGITGSTGKTSTKDLAATALRTRRTVHASEGSFNNELGVPLTVLRAPAGTDVLVVEMGARGSGQIAELRDVAGPRVGVVTNVGAAHMEFFGDLGAVAEEKGALLEDVETAVVGTGHDWVEHLVRRASGRVLLAGTGPGADVAHEGLRLDDDLRPGFDLRTPWGSTPVRLAMRGAHQATNAAVAAAAALSLGVPLDDVAAGLSCARGSRWRMQVQTSPDGVTVINDAYNANPSSTAAALEALAALERPGRRIAVLGHMAELGDGSEEAHRRVGEQAAALGVDRLVVVGEGTEPIVAGAGDGPDVAVVGDAGEAASLLAREVRSGDVVLVKASRVVGLEEVARVLSGGAPR